MDAKPFQNNDHIQISQLICNIIVYRSIICIKSLFPLAMCNSVTYYTWRNYIFINDCGDLLADIRYMV